MTNGKKPKALPLDEVGVLRQQMAELIHDIKDPLGVILGYSRLLQQEAPTCETAERTRMLERIHKNAMLINALLLESVDL